MVNYASLSIGRRLTVFLAAAPLVEWVIALIIIGLVYKPKTS
jgi:hypothetical protein